MKLQPHHLTQLRQRFFRKELSDIFETSEMTLWRWENPVNKPLQKKGPKPKVNQNTLKHLGFYLKRNSDLNQREIANYLSQQINQPISQQTVSLLLRKSNITYKKLTYQYSERKKHKMAQEVWRFSSLIKRYIPTGIVPSKLLALDECSFHLNEAPRRGYSLKGTRTISQRPGNKGVNHTLILCIQFLESQGVIHYKLIKGGLKTQSFHDFLQGINLSSQEKHYLFLDNAKVHHAKKSCLKLDLPTVRDLLASKNIEPVYSVPYTPELNPVELCFNIIRQSVEKQRPRTFEELELAIDKVVAELQKENFIEFFRHAFAKLTAWRVFFNH
ncbi:IS630 family transposase [endosymbiont GvMRE of Glomus versiforme]|uniref:IS630 family transposase n=1 Tax=endosymbiont GvMRE of Glomus versiforme TaxID=2039283 RepID=UPI000EC6AD45|nr:IS630 family transposase [endosymbiont GvMRE of Glomus versiforme]RHZ36566.1 Transposase [endosymbiont GvMRE of Glomus versiforme]